jgi:protein gp37
MIVFIYPVTTPQATEPSEINVNSIMRDMIARKVNSPWDSSNFKIMRQTPKYIQL